MLNNIHISYLCRKSKIIYRSNKIIVTHLKTRSKYFICGFSWKCGSKSHANRKNNEKYGTATLIFSPPSENKCNNLMLVKCMTPRYNVRATYGCYCTGKQQVESMEIYEQVSYTSYDMKIA